MEDSIITINKRLKITYLKSKNIVNETQVIIHLNGINFNNSLNRFWKIQVEEFPPFLFLNLPGNDPNLKPYRTNWKYLKIIKGFIDAFKNEFPKIEKFYITGESWGANLALLYAKKFSNSIAGVVCWNAPSKINTKLSQKSKLDNLNIGIQHILCFLLNINFRCFTGDMNQITNNEILLRIYHQQCKLKLGFTRLDLAVWYAMKPSFRYLKKHFKSNMNLPIVYIQTKEDCYYKLNIKKLNKIIQYSNNTNKIIIQEQGMHLLSLDVNDNDKIIWKEIKLMVRGN
ncbi:MAG: alpha/beta hydrolase [Mycoplasma sp.]|nr:alpha/beta hydrolase [Mycoplasma sp.]